MENTEESIYLKKIYYKAITMILGEGVFSFGVNVNGFFFINYHISI